MTQQQKELKCEIFDSPYDLCEYVNKHQIVPFMITTKESQFGTKQVLYFYK